MQTAERALSRYELDYQHTFHRLACRARGEKFWHALQELTERPKLRFKCGGPETFWFDVVEERIRVFDAGGFQLASFLATEGFKNGEHRRAGAPVYSGSNQTSRGGTRAQWITWAATGVFPDPEPPKPIENAGIRAGEIVGHRCWLAIDDRLFSVYRRTEWIPGQPMTGDVKEYGVHAFKHDDLFLASYGMWNSLELAMRNGLGDLVYGTIDLWGEVIEHQHGWRASRGAIRTLARGFQRDADLARLRARYMVEASTDCP